MRTGLALPHIVINAPDPLLCLLPLLEQRVVVRLAEADHARLTRRAAAAPVSPPLPEADDRAQADRDRTQQAHQQGTDARRTALVGFAPRRWQLHRLVARRAQERIDAGKHTLIELARLELRDDVGIENRARLAVGKHALEPIADLDADAAIAGGPEQQQPVVLALLADAPELEELTAASSIDRPSSDPITTTAISAPFVRSNSPMVELSRAIVSARSIPGMSVTQVPSRARGLGMLVSGSAPAAAIKRGMSAASAIKVRDISLTS